MSEFILFYTIFYRSAANVRNVANVTYVLDLVIFL